ncbi:LuxR family transcriptional regulator [Novosphingobium sp. PP1Y]|uniref:LuxR family transcriptional regulator n=1 Tax=Novosphingobium sp. PP1Y TaxID=702113 RepID=UPI00020EFB89|nr:LuxR family transcriptional regulator [Novosphingobium sp. PP1Y]CCA90729.1 LuxR family transcriptional regulator [Novosphingobium sp. PP1Y]
MLAAELADTFTHSRSGDELHEALARSAHEMGFDHFALALEVGGCAGNGISVLIHDYPASWADAYVDFNLAASDPVRRAAERSVLGFKSCGIGDLIPVTEAEQSMFNIGRRHGVADGYTVPQQVPDDLTGSCSFVTAPSRNLPEAMLAVAELVGAVAIASGRRVAGWEDPVERPRLTDHQRDYVLWAARGKTDWETSKILGISHETVIQHLKEARERSDTTKRASLIIFATPRRGEWI